jgi:hypothetical protein
VDGTGALLKREIHKKQMNFDGRKLQNAVEIVQFLKEQSSRVHAGPSNARNETKKYFWEIPWLGPNSVDRRDIKQAEGVLGSMSNRQCRSMSAQDPTLIQFHHLSCLCFACFSYGSGDCCHQSNRMLEFSLYRLSPKAPS